MQTKWYTVKMESRSSQTGRGGILGGISSGQDIITRFAVKPASSILIPRDTVDTRWQ